MSTQIAIRLPDELVTALDAQVRNGAASNRTELITAMLKRELRRAMQAEEQRIFEQPWDDADDLNGLAEWAVRQPLPLGD